MQRRSFLLYSGSLALSQLLFGCAGQNQIALSVQLLKGSIPSQVVQQFRSSLQQQVQLRFSPVEQLQDLFQQLQKWQKTTKTSQGWTSWNPLATSDKSITADVATLGDYWLAGAVAQKLIQPLEVEKLKQWSKLPKRWQELVTRNNQGLIDAQGNIWAVPYRWGSTIMIYRLDRFKELGWIPRDWSDLWRSELRSRISVLDHPREAIGLVLKKLGMSYNTENLRSVPDLEKQLQALDQQVKFYSSNKYLEPLITGDTWLAVGWSNDVSSVLARYPQLAVAIPQSGTALWADLWVSPADGRKSQLLYDWIDFCLTPSIAQEISLLTRAHSPVTTKTFSSDIQEQLRNLLLFSDEIFQKSEFLLPLPPSTAREYISLFQKMKD